MNISDVFSLTSIYLALIGLLSTFFFINLTQWINSIKGLNHKWDTLKNADKQKYYNERLECYKQAAEYNSNWTLTSWIISSSFLLITFSFQLIAIFRQPCNEEKILVFYILIPSAIFLLIYFCLSVIILVKGYGFSKKIKNEYS